MKGMDFFKSNSETMQKWAKKAARAAPPPSSAR